MGVDGDDEDNWWIERESQNSRNTTSKVAAMRRRYEVRRRQARRGRRRSVAKSVQGTADEVQVIGNGGRENEGGMMTTGTPGDDAVGGGEGRSPNPLLVEDEYDTDFGEFEGAEGTASPQAGAGGGGCGGGGDACREVEGKMKGLTVLDPVVVRNEEQLSAKPRHVDAGYFSEEQKARRRSVENVIPFEAYDKLLGKEEKSSGNRLDEGIGERKIAQEATRVPIPEDLKDLISYSVTGGYVLEPQAVENASGLDPFLFIVNHGLTTKSNDPKSDYQEERVGDTEEDEDIDEKLKTLGRELESEHDFVPFDKKLNWQDSIARKHILEFVNKSEKRIEAKLAAERATAAHVTNAPSKAASEAEAQTVESVLQRERWDEWIAQEEAATSAALRAVRLNFKKLQKKFGQSTSSSESSWAFLSSKSSSAARSKRMDSSTALARATYERAAAVNALLRPEEQAARKRSHRRRTATKRGAAIRGSTLRGSSHSSSHAEYVQEPPRKAIPSPRNSIELRDTYAPDDGEIRLNAFGGEFLLLEDDFMFGEGDRTLSTAGEGEGSEVGYETKETLQSN